MYNQTPFWKLLRKNDVPEKGTPLQKQFEENPKLLLREVEYLYAPATQSVISLLILSLGELHLSDFILKPGSDKFALKADPFYLGKACVNLKQLPISSGVNFYLALITWQYYSQKNKLSELIDRPFTETFTLKKNYYDLFYWKDESGKPHYACDLQNSLEQRTFMRAQADWFMQLAYEVFMLEEQLKKSLQYSKTFLGQVEHLLIATDLTELKICATLGDYYLHMAYMEISSHSAFSYFIKKSHGYYAQSSQSNTYGINQLAELVRRMESTSDRVWNETNAQQYGPLKDCGIAGHDYSINISEAWRNAFNFAHQKINDQGISSSLSFMELDSGRTSLEERNSQSSGELLEAKGNDTSLTKMGLHQRKREPKMTTNPLSLSKLST